MRKVVIVGVGMTKFGRRVEGLMQLLSEASLAAMDDAGIGDKPLDAVYVSNMAGGIFNHQTALGSSLVDRLSLLPAAAETVENGPASGSSAIKNAYFSIASGAYDLVMVTGGEKMGDVPGFVATDGVATMSHPEAEYPLGITLPSLAAMFAKLYMERYGITSEQLATVALKNHLNGLKNPYSHIRGDFILEGVLHCPESIVNNPFIAEPLRLYDCCPVSDGAASVILCAEEKAKEFPNAPVVLAGFGQATDHQTIHEREDPTDLKAVTLAAKKALDMAKLTPKDIDVAELHDAFTILEIAQSEHVGFFKKGEGGKAVEAGLTQIGGKIPINPSGGLKSRGHPVGATGVAQVVELVWQLRGQAGERQVKNASRGFSLNFGGFGNNVIAFVLKKGA
jgi:acetyl-CoA C-acetyltransferase